jgi:hypothetical protein
MEQETGTQQDGVYDPSVGMVVTESGKAHWRRRLAEGRAEADRDHEARAALLEKLRQGPAAFA